jgi:hypothetical protein
MEFRTIKRDGSGDIEYVEYLLNCTGSIVRLYRDDASDSGWRQEERELEAAR